ncbi:hypothetical protein E2562_029439 [Oryza meyeriana var. granulata]|uniref:Uncharacterized protein n=1 Tax=Oryza meyeriana var. granulata TaxID=110450 RepID=A0A6G1E4C1_9ORYZ|nr:hypothetical protein E2562_029439 [Oryza meyeriana var. granulata]
MISMRRYRSLIRPPLIAVLGRAALCRCPRQLRRIKEVPGRCLLAAGTDWRPFLAVVPILAAANPPRHRAFPPFSMLADASTRLVRTPAAPLSFPPLPGRAAVLDGCRR